MQRFIKNITAREAIGALFICLGMVSIVMNQKIDIDGGFNFYAIFSRHDLWFALAVFFVAVTKPNSVFFLRSTRLNSSVLLLAPCVYLILCFLSSAMATLAGDAVVDYFGINYLATVILSCLMGIFIFKIAKNSLGYIDIMIFVFSLIPLISLSSFLFGLGFDNDSNDGRFRGFSTNPNIVAIQSSIALGITMPYLLSIKSIFSIKSWAIIAAFIASLVTSLITGTRAAVVVLALLIVVEFWFRFGKSNYSIRTIFLSIVPLTLIFAALLTTIVSSGLLDVLFYRAESGDEIRTEIWRFYVDKILNRPWGYGFGFESIIDVANIYPPLRLPPHNFLILTAVYSGILGFLVVIISMCLVLHNITGFRSIRATRISIRYECLMLAWFANLGNLFFGGTYFGDYNSAILTSLLLAVNIHAKRLGELPRRLDGVEFISKAQVLLRKRYSVNY